MTDIRQRSRRLASLARAASGLYAALLLAGFPAPGGAREPVSLSGAAPELVGGSWLNTEKNAPLTLASLRGQVVILHFWTFG